MAGRPPARRLGSLAALEALRVDLVAIIERAGDVLARPASRAELEGILGELAAWDRRAVDAGVDLEPPAAGRALQ